MTKKEEKPQILEPLRDIVICKGENTVLTVQISGNPIPEIKWFKNDKEILDLPTKKEGTVYTCTLKKILEKDTGKYSVTATNSLGEVKCNCNVIVESTLKFYFILKKTIRLT